MTKKRRRRDEERMDGKSGKFEAIATACYAAAFAAVSLVMIYSM